MVVVSCAELSLLLLFSPALLAIVLVMLSSDKSSSAVLKLVDFGSASIQKEGDEDGSSNKPLAAATPAYSPPEFLDNVDKPVNSTFDMWAIGVIIYIMLTGIHPFDLYGDGTDDEIEKAIRSGHRPPTWKSPVTSHLSPHAIKLLDLLFERDPSKRMTAHDLLENPWVQGKTARQQKMANSDKRLSALRTFKTKLTARIFAGMVASGGIDQDGFAKRTSLIERAFNELDTSGRGYVTTKELERHAGHGDGSGDESGSQQICLSGFSDLVSNKPCYVSS